MSPVLPSSGETWRCNATKEDVEVFAVGDRFYNGQLVSTMVCCYHGEVRRFSFFNLAEFREAFTFEAPAPDRQASVRARVCGTKLRHRTEHRAQRSADSANERFGEHQHVYQCPFCDMWHCGGEMTARRKASW